MKISPLFGFAEKGAYLFFMSAVGGVGGYQAAKQRMLVKEFAQKAGMSEQDVMVAVREGRIRELASFANDKADAKRQAVKFVDSVQKSINLYMQHRHNIDCIRNGRLFMDCDEKVSSDYIRLIETQNPWVRDMATDI